MRPRVFPAEDIRRHRRAERLDGGFNEAAGIPRGRHPLIRSVLASIWKLQ